MHRSKRNAAYSEPEVQDQGGDRHAVEDKDERRNLGNRYAGKEKRTPPKKAEKQ